MKYELHKFESIVAKYCRDKIDLSSEEYEILLKIIEDEFFRIKDILINNYLLSEKKYLFKKYIRQHQLGIIKLLDKVYSTLSQFELNNIYVFESSNNNVNIKKILYKKLESLLTFIESYFTKYFNIDNNIPARYQIIAKHEIERKLNSNIEVFNKKSNCQLLKITSLPFDEFCNSNRKITFRELIYLKKLLSAICNTCYNCMEINATCPLKRKLVFLNFNSYRLFSFLTSQIINEYLDKETLNHQIEFLCYCLKRINQAQEKPGYVYKKDIKSLKDQLSIWLVEEISFLEKKQQLSFNPGTNISETIPKDFKITTECSVSQVAYLLRLLVDSGAITNKNQREIINFFANNIKTKKADNVSPESLRTKYYNTESSTIEAVKDLIIKMLNKIQKDK